MGWDRHKLLWGGTDKYFPWATLLIEQEFRTEDAVLREIGVLKNCQLIDLFVNSVETSYLNTDKIVWSGPRHGKVPPWGELKSAVPPQSKSAAPPGHGLKQSQAFQIWIIS